MEPYGVRKTFEISNQIEENFDVISILEPIVGPGQVRASVRVDLNTAQVTEMVEEYDPASAAVRSEERSEEGSTRGAQDAVGAPGAAANLRGNAQAAAQTATSTNSRETINYELNTRIREIRQGGVQVGSVGAVVIVRGI